MKDYILEVCADSVESVLAAEEGGATRIELCQNLVIGGTTPGPKFFEEVRRHSKIRIHALIRPRFGDFCYSDYEYAVIREEVKMYRQLGAEGVVIGILKQDGTLNMEQMEGLMREAEGMSVTLHRAFDVCADPFAALENAVKLGIDTILTSGQKNSCSEGAELLRKLEEQSAGRICIQAGGGVSADVIEALAPVTGIRAWHMSGKVTLDSRMQYRKEGVSMGLPSLSEYDIYRTSAEKIRAAEEVLKRI
ncbi:MAG TPA: copper homeostasis protein CutC [Candidatus Fusicatenibacter intestinigallinarum]|uniref:PF03932 family protein CutC n=1 Tax=Candidatus Fusicatenibacter intestinigallinarum TaxID=2838598 RepID=A0A9D2SM15_9FIRM|nr:copper homeostasis protein CutC [Candidatus Fusicatenibacter intestinigallinarum]